MDSWDYAKDNRTTEEVRNDFNLGKDKEREAMSRLPFLIYSVNKDEFGIIKEYAPDWFIYKDFFWYPAEFKYSQAELKYVDIKQNQCDWLSEHGGIVIVFTPTKFMISLASKVQTECELENDTYCSKPCYRILNPDWHYF